MATTQKDLRVDFRKTFEALNAKQRKQVVFAIRCKEMLEALPIKKLSQNLREFWVALP